MTAKNQFKIALYFFILISLFGLILRIMPLYSLPFNYSFLLHAHSHVAFLGWLHGGFISFISYIFLNHKLNTTTFKWIYWFTILNVVGMTISFPLQGYKFFSILFLSLFLIGTYLYTWYFFKHRQIGSFKSTYLFVKTGLLLQILSSLSPWSLGLIIKFFGKNSPYYKYDIFYYLHFQYNGWFLFSTIAIAFFMLEKRHITIPVQQVKNTHRLMLIAVFLGFFSNILWNNPGIIYNFLAIVGATAEIIAFFVLLLIFNRYYRYLQNQLGNFNYLILKLVFFTFMIKITLQFIGSFQYYADLSYQIRDFIIGYLHLIMLGIFTPFLIIVASELKFIFLSKKAFYTFYTGFLITEILIFTKGIFYWFKIDNFSYLLMYLIFIFTFIMFIGILLILLKSKHKNESIQSISF